MEGESRLIMVSSYTTLQFAVPNIGCASNAIRLTQAELLVESLSARLATQEILECLHLVLAAAALEDGVTVPAALLCVHGILLKDGVEHVCGVHLGTVGVSLASCPFLFFFFPFFLSLFISPSQEWRTSRERIWEGDGRRT